MRLKIRMLLSIVGIVILQIAIVISVIGLTKTTDSLDKSSVLSLSNMVWTRGNELEKTMVEWSRIEAFVEEITKTASEYSKKEKKDVKTVLKDKEVRSEILNELTTVVIDTLREKKVTDCFVILDDGSGSRKKDALYLRDLNPQDKSEKNHDILVEAGASDLMFTKGLTLDSYWSAKLTVEDAFDFYHKPFQAGNEYPTIDAMNLGYWSTAFRLNEFNIESITFTVPLLDENHQSYGVAGIGISLDYLNEFLNAKEISIEGNGTYYMGVTTDGRNYKTVFTDNSYYQAKIPNQSTLVIEDNKKENELKALRIEGEKEAEQCSLIPLHLYNSNTPFEKEQWTLAGIVHTSKIYQASGLLKTALLFALGISFVISFFGAIFTITMITRPIKLLMDGVRKLTPKHVSLPRTNIFEMDELAKEIETQNKALYKAGCKVADILRMADIGLGVMEVIKNSDMVYCTDKVFVLFDMDVPESIDKDWDNYMDKESVCQYFDPIQKKVKAQKEEPDVYYFTLKDGSTRWVHAKRAGTDNDYLYVFTDITHNMLEKQKIKHDRDYDVLTDLYNRRAFAREVTTLIEEGICMNAVLSIWDLDNLKYVNDTYGHDMGDQFIRMLANLLSVEGKDNMISARMAGDEFMLFLYNEELEIIYERIKWLHQTFLTRQLTLPDDKKMKVSASAGMAAYGIHGNTYEDLLRYADFAMYEIKNKEKGGIKVFDPDSYVKDYLLMQGVGELNRILSEASVRYAFQPIISMKNETIFAYEALIRPVSDLITNPGELLRLAEKQSRLWQIESLTWFHALSEFFKQTKQMKNTKVFINSIPGQSLRNEEWQKLEKLYGEDLKRIIMEETESVKMNTDLEQKKLDWCKKWGISVALDDFGTGYSNNDTLMSGIFQLVKIDISLVHNIHKNQTSEKFVRSIIEYCHENQIEVLAEGIELKEELIVVKELGVDYVQGYYMGRPDFFIKEMDYKSKF